MRTYNGKRKQWFLFHNPAALWLEHNEVQLSLLNTNVTREAEVTRSDGKGLLDPQAGPYHTLSMEKQKRQCL